MKVLFAKERVFCVLRAYVLLIGFFVLWLRILVLYGTGIVGVGITEKAAERGSLKQDIPLSAAVI